jgi:hypothetical protein
MIVPLAAMLGLTRLSAELPIDNNDFDDDDEADDDDGDDDDNDDDGGDGNEGLVIIMLLMVSFEAGPWPMPLLLNLLAVGAMTESEAMVCGAMAS